MAIYVNGVKVAGRGNSGKSPYMLAVEGGYTGTEAEFNQQLKAIGEAVSVVKQQIEECKQIIADANNTFNTAIINAKNEIDIMVGNAANAATDAQNAADKAKDTANQALIDIEQAKQDAIKLLDGYNIENKVNRTGDKMTGSLELYADPTLPMEGATKKYVDEKTSSIVTDIFYYGTTAPTNAKLLWISSASDGTGVLKFNKPGVGWVPVPVAWS